MEQTFQQFVENYIDEVITDMDFADMTDEERDEFRILIAQRIDKRLLALILEHLPEEKFKELTTKLDSKEWTEEEQQEILGEYAEHVPEFEDKIAKEFYLLKKELIEDAMELKKLAEPQ